MFWHGFLVLMEETRENFAVGNTEVMVLAKYSKFVSIFDQHQRLTADGFAGLHFDSIVTACHLCLRCQCCSDIHHSCQIVWHIFRKLLPNCQYKLCCGYHCKCGHLTWSLSIALNLLSPARVARNIDLQPLEARYSRGAASRNVES